MTKLLATSVVRGARQGDSHGGAYLIDLEAGRAEQVLDWNAPNIDWSGRGGDRGLRGIAFAAGHVFLAASDELFVFDQALQPAGSYRSPWLKHCHEMATRGDTLFLTCTGFDAILGFDLQSRAFTWGLQLTREGAGVAGRPFDPATGPPAAPQNQLHLNNVTANANGLFLSGLRLPALLRYVNGRLSPVASLPLGTHNAQPLGQGLAFNDTDADCLRYVTPSRQRTFPVPSYHPNDLAGLGQDASGLARAGFARGLCAISETVVAGGSSPSTVAIHDLSANKTLSLVTLSVDVRHAIHGLAVWPY